MATVGTTTNSAALASMLNSTSTQTSNTKSNGTVNKDEFLQMFVTQLKNQDPMDPMKSDDFAVNLAQFSQLEQLVSINQTLEKGQGTDMSSMASYLGQQVAWDSNSVEVKNGDGGRINFTLGSASSNLSVQLLDAKGGVLSEIPLGAAGAGNHTAILSGLEIANGNYTAQLVSTDSKGNETVVPANVAGIVTGFIPGADPTLIVGDQQVKPADITMISIPGSVPASESA